MKKLELIIDDESNITIEDSGKKLPKGDERVKFILQCLRLEEIKNMLLADDRIAYNPVLKENIARIALNYYLQQMSLIQNNHMQILQLALNDTREELEEEEATENSESF